MAVNLTGKADATIATAAARAGAALAGPDYSKSFQGIATGYSQAMGKMGAGLQSLAFVGTVATSNLVKNIQTAKEKYGSQDFSAVKGHFKGLIKEGFDVIFSKKEDRDLEKEEFKSKFQNSFGSLKGMINGTFFAEKLVEEGEYNRAYLEENPAEAAKFDILRSTKENPVKAEGLPYDGCYSELEMVDGNWKRMYYGPNGEKITSFDEDGTPKFKGTEQVGSDQEERVVKNPREKLKGKIVPGSETPPGENEGAMYTGGIGSEEEYMKVDNLLGKYTTKTYGDIESSDKGSIDKALKIMGYETNAEGFAKFQEDDMFSSSFNRPNLVGEAEVVAEAEHFGLDETGVGGLIVRKNPDVQVAIQEAQLAAMQDGADGLEFKPNEYKNVLKEVINTRDKFVDMTYTPIGNQEYSYAQLLAQPNEMTKEMFNQVVSVADGLSGIDRGADNVLNMQDFDGPEDAANLAILRKGMLNYNNPQAREIFYDFLTQEGASQHKLRFDKYKRDNTVVTTGGDDDEDGFIRTKKSVQPTAGFVDSNKYFPASSMNNLALDINKHADIEMEDGTFASWNDAGYYQYSDGEPIRNKVSLLSSYFGEELTNDFKLTDVYRSIEDWDAGGATSTSKGINKQFESMITGNFKAGFKESATEKNLITTLKAMQDTYPQVTKLITDLESLWFGSDADLFSGYKLKIDADGDGKKETYDFGSEPQKDAAAQQFIAALNRRIAGGTVNNEFAQ